MGRLGSLNWTSSVPLQCSHWLQAHIGNKDGFQTPRKPYV
jgi:hypothetical protein